MDWSKKLLIITNLQTLKIRYPAVRAKFTKIENKVPDIINLPAKAALKGTWGKSTSFSLK